MASRKDWAVLRRHWSAVARSLLGYSLSREAWSTMKSDHVMLASSIIKVPFIHDDDDNDGDGDGDDDVVLIL